MFFYNTVVAQAYRVDVSPSRITFTFLAEPEGAETAVRGDASRGSKSIAEKVSGRRSR